MAKLLATLSADAVRFNFGGLVSVAVGVVDLLTRQRLGTPLDTTLVIAGLAALGIHVSDTVGSQTALSALTSKEVGK